MWTIFRGGRIHIWCFCICGRIKSFSIVSVNAALSEDKWTQWESSEQIFLSEDPSAAQRLHSISFLFTACILKYHLDAQCVHNRKVKTGCWGGGRPDCEARWTLPPSSTRTDRYLIPPFFFFFFSKSVFLQFSGSFSPPWNPAAGKVTVLFYSPQVAKQIDAEWVSSKRSKIRNEFFLKFAQGTPPRLSERCRTLNYSTHTHTHFLLCFHRSTWWFSSNRERLPPQHLISCTHTVCFRATWHFLNPRYRGSARLDTLIETKCFSNNRHNDDKAFRPW